MGKWKGKRVEEEGKAERVGERHEDKGGLGKRRGNRKRERGEEKKCEGGTEMWKGEGNRGKNMKMKEKMNREIK